MKSSINIQRCIVILPGIFDFEGGIEKFSYFFVKALKDILPDAEYVFFIKNDKVCLENPLFPNNCKVRLYGKLPRLLRTFVFAGQILIEVLRKKPDLIICGHLYFSPIAYWIRKIWDIPYWIIVHGREAWGIKSRRLHKALINAYRILSVSNYTRNKLIKEHVIGPEKIMLFPNTFDENMFRIGHKPEYLFKRYGIDNSSSIILTVARLNKIQQYKGYDKILRSLPEIIRVVPNVHYIIVGRGSDCGRIKNIVSDLKLESSVTLAGFVTDRELCDHYNLCDLFAMPSKAEGFGIVFLEALACGKPVLGGNQDGTVDALYNGKFGVLVDPDDLQALSRVMIQILKKEHPLEIIYKPEELRKEVIEKFGFINFRDALAQSLNKYFKKLDNKTSK